MELSKTSRGAAVVRLLLLEDSRTDARLLTATLAEAASRVGARAAGRILPKMTVTPVRAQI